MRGGSQSACPHHLCFVLSRRLPNKGTWMSTEYDPDEYVRGEMDIHAQHAAFNGFIRWSMYIALISIVVCLFLLIFRT